MIEWTLIGIVIAGLALLTFGRVAPTCEVCGRVLIDGQCPRPSGLRAGRSWDETHVGGKS